jgi:predicted aspartyl protease
MRRSSWRAAREHALLRFVLRHRHVIVCGWLAGVLLSGALAADPAAAPAPPPAPPAAPTSTTGAGPPAEPAAQPPPSEEELQQIIVEAPEPRYVAPTRRDRIGRIWAPVLIDGKGPYRLVLDTGANHSAITARTAQSLGIPASEGTARVTGFTGSAVVPIVHVSKLEVGDLLIGPQDLPVLSDVFGGAEGVLGIEGLEDKRIFADFSHDTLVISHSHGERARADFTTVPLRVINGLLVADIRVGTVRTKAIIDTGAQGTVGNIALRNALVHHQLENNKRTEVMGVTLDVQSGDNLPAPDITLGRLTVHGVRVIYGDMYLFQHWQLTDQPTMTLGMDFLGTFDVLIIDYARHEMQVRLNGARLPD